MFGCGNSKLSQDVWNEMTDPCCRTVSKCSYWKMKQRHEQVRLEMDWRRMCQSELVNIGVAPFHSTSGYKVDETLRCVFPPLGTFTYLTFGQPHFHRRYLTRPNTTLEIKASRKAFNYYLYILPKD
ncbi:hypothetical protein AN958_04001 [Leucoagaricus sp. SymC.cos]|nr:hypothetical protein AN958_04001 [Leucoagaricus sp. SymC.cos]